MTRRHGLPTGRDKVITSVPHTFVYTSTYNERK